MFGKILGSHDNINEKERSTTIEIGKLILESKYADAIELAKEYSSSIASEELAEKSVFLHAMAAVYYENRQFEESFQTIMKITPSLRNAEILCLQSLIHIKFGKFLDAASVAQEAIKLEPNNPGPYILKGDAFKHLDFIREAQENFKIGLELIRALPEDNDVGNNLDKAIYYRTLGLNQEGRSYSIKVETDAPNYATGYVNHAINSLHEYIQYADSNSASSELTNNELSAQYKYLISDAHKSLDKAIDLNENDCIAYFYKALAFEAQGKNKLAKSFCEEALSINPEYAGPIFELSKLSSKVDEKTLYKKSIIHASNGKFNEALDILNQIISKNKSHSKSKSNDENKVKNELLSTLRELMEASSCLKSNLNPIDILSKIVVDQPESFSKNSPAPSPSNAARRGSVSSDVTSTMDMIGEDGLYNSSANHYIKEAFESGSPVVSPAKYHSPLKRYDSINSMSQELGIFNSGIISDKEKGDVALKKVISTLQVAMTLLSKNSLDLNNLSLA